MPITDSERLYIPKHRPIGIDRYQYMYWQLSDSETMGINLFSLGQAANK